VAVEVPPLDRLSEKFAQPDLWAQVHTGDRILLGTTKWLDILWLNRMINHSVPQILRGVRGRENPCPTESSYSRINPGNAGGT
jgi:hypothetical protein